MSNEHHPNTLKDIQMEKVSGGSYFKYTLADGQTLWFVFDGNTGDFDPGYQSEEDAIEADKRYHGTSERTEDRKFYF